MLRRVPCRFPFSPFLLIPRMSRPILIFWRLDILLSWPQGRQTRKRRASDTEATRLQARTPNACIACQVSAGVVRCSPLVIVPRGPCCCGFRSQALPFLVSGGHGHAMIVGCLLVACVRGVLRRSGSDRLGLVERGTTTICSLGLLVN